MTVPHHTTPHARAGRRTQSVSRFEAVVVIVVVMREREERISQRNLTVTVGRVRTSGKRGTGFGTPVRCYSRCYYTYDSVWSVRCHWYLRNTVIVPLRAQSARVLHLNRSVLRSGKDGEEKKGQITAVLCVHYVDSQTASRPALFPPPPLFPSPSKKQMSNTGGGCFRSCGSIQRSTGDVEACCATYSNTNIHGTRP